MKKRMSWFITGVAVTTCSFAEVVITSPPGLPDESDVVLEAAVETVREVPSDTAGAVVDAVGMIADEVRNTAHGIKSVCEGSTPRETVRKKMLNEASEAWSADGEIQVRSYKLSPTIAAELAGGSNQSSIDARSFFAGIDFPKGSSAVLRPRTGTLSVFNTRPNLRRIEQALSRYQAAENDFKQVEINAKFVEVSQSTLNELGFSWKILPEEGGDGVFPLSDHFSIPDDQNIFSAGLRTAAAAFGAGTPAAGSVVLTKAGWMPLKVVISALEQASDSDVLSAPSLTTRDGKKAEIWVGEDRQVPERFDVNSSSVNIHIEHTDWDSRLMGVYFRVKPEIRKDNIIRLDLHPEIVDMVGYDSYRVAVNCNRMQPGLTYGRFPILNTDGSSDMWNKIKSTLLAMNPLDFSNDAGGDPGPGGEPNFYDDGTTVKYFRYYAKPEHDEMGYDLPSIWGHLPYFRVRRIETKVDVLDGNTVGLGGLIYDRLETFKDKVPVLGSIPLLGRLFRSEGERSIKRNLMVFVSATKVADNGQRRSEISNVK